jgi:hypothetical protein
MKRLLMKTALASLAALIGFAPSSADEPKPAGDRKLPPIDLEAPREFETATFALG